MDPIVQDLPDLDVALGVMGLDVALGVMGLAIELMEVVVAAEPEVAAVRHASIRADLRKLCS
jgi:hypothetical protein